MSTEITTVKELSDNIIAQLEATLNQSIPALPKSFFRVLARAVAAVYILLYKYIGFGQLQIFVKTASSKPTNVNGLVLTPLYEWGELVGAGLPAPATRAQLEVRVTVETQTGTLPAGSQLLYSLTGVTYITTTTVSLNTAAVDVIVEAVASQDGGNGAGAIGNVEVGNFLSFANPLSNVARDAEVISQVVAGADGEDVEVYRQRVLDRFRARPQGGALTDYRLWGEEPAGIINVYPYRDPNCPGQVVLYSEATPESSGNPDGIPTLAQLQEVADAVEFDSSGLASRRPVGALVQSLPIARVPFDVEVVGIVDVNDLAATEAAITTAVQEYMAEREPFIVGLDFAPKLDRVNVNALGGIVEDIVTANGGSFTSVILFEQAVSIITRSLTLGEKAKLNQITFN